MQYTFSFTYLRKIWLQVSYYPYDVSIMQKQRYPMLYEAIPEVGRQSDKMEKRKTF